MLTTLTLQNHSLEAELDLVSLENSSSPQVFPCQTAPQIFRPVSRRLEENAVQLPPTHLLSSIPIEMKSLGSAHKYAICSDIFLGGGRQWSSHHLPTPVDQNSFFGSA